MKKRAKNIAHFIAKDFPRIVKVEHLEQIKHAFEKEGHTDTALKKWKPRKTLDKYGRTITRYRTNRVGRAGSPNKYGRNISGRPILTGHHSGANKLRNSYHGRIAKGRVIIYSYKPYAQRHNEGTEGMPMRKHIGHSRRTDRRISIKTNKHIDKILS